MSVFTRLTQAGVASGHLAIRRERMEAFTLRWMAEKAILLLFLLLLLPCYGEEEHRLLWSLEMNSPTRWSVNSSGKMTIRGNEQEKSIRFDVVFPEAGDWWVYPSFRFRKTEYFRDAETLTFDVKAKQSNPSAGYRLCLVQFPGGKIPFPAPPADGKWQSVRINLRQQKIDYSKVSFIQIGFNPGSPEFSFELRNIRLSGRSSREEAIDLADAITFSAPGTAFLDKEPVIFQFKPQYQVPVTYTVENWQGNIVSRGEFSGSGNSELKLSPLPCGYYRLKVESKQLPFTGKQSFAVLPDLRTRRNNDSPYCVDTCLSWLGRPNALSWMTRDKEPNFRYPDASYDLGAELCSRLGISTVRERLSWAGTEPEPGKFSWGQYLSNAKLLASKKVQILDVYHDAPKWATQPEGKSYPADALEVYTYAYSVAKAMKGAVQYWEFFNEEDLGGRFSPKAGCGAWEYTAMLKAAVYGFKKGAPEIKAMNGGLAFLPLRTFIDTCIKNDYAQYGDLLNVHTYRSLKGYPEMIADIKTVMRRNGAENLPVWFTEIGTYLEGAGEVDSYLSGLKEHSEKQELIVAEFIPKANILLQLLGVEKSFLFVLLPQNEGAGQKVWGQLRHDFTVKPGYVAMATLIDQLGDATMIGEMKMPEGIRAFLYRRPDNSQTVVLWSVSPLETKDVRGFKSMELLAKEAVFPASREIAATNFLGCREVLLPERGKVHVKATRYPLYLTGLHGLTADIAVQPPPKFFRDENEYDKSIIMNIQFPSDCKVSMIGDAITIPEDQTNAVLQIWNLSEAEKICFLKFSGAQITGFPPQITLAPGSKKEIPVQINCGDRIIGDLVFSGSTGDKKITRLTIPFQQFHKMAASGFQQELMWSNDPNMWHGPFVNRTGFDEKEQAVTMDISFPKGTHPWSYPEYLLQLPQESMTGAYGISFELKADTDIGMCLFITPMNTPGRPGRIVEYNMSPPEKDRWKEHIVLLNEDTDEITALRLGMTPKDGNPFRLSIRKIRLLYRNGKK